MTAAPDLVAPGKAYLTLDEMAERYGVKPRWFDARTRPSRSILPHHKVGGEKRFSAQDVAWCDEYFARRPTQDAADQEQPAGLDPALALRSLRILNGGKRTAA